MTELLTFTIVGIASGCIYALTATGLVVTYITSGVFNFAHGAIGMIAAFLFWELSVNQGWPTPVAFVFVVGIFAPLLGVAIDRFLMRRVQGAPTEVTLVITLLLLLIMISVAAQIWNPSEPRPLPEFFEGTQFHIFGVNISAHQMIVLLAAVGVAVGLRLFLYQTRTGVALRAVVDAPELASLNGARPEAVSQVGWAIGSSLAALAGVLLAPLVTLDILTLTLLVINGYAAAIVGRLRSLPLTFAGGIGLGLFEAYATHFLPIDVLSTVRTSLPIVFLFAAVILFPDRRVLNTRGLKRKSLRVPNPRQALRNAGIFVAAAVVLSFFLNDGDMNTVSKGVATALILLSIVLLTGYAGQISLCQLTFVGVGAYGMGTFGAGGSLVGVFAALILAAGVGAVVALPALRLRGLYLALSTLAFAQGMSALFFNNNKVFGTGGALAVPRLSLLGISLDSSRSYLIFSSLVFAAGAIGVLHIRRSALGRRLSAMSDSPAACATLGLNLTSTKLLVFTMSAGLAGLGGVVYGGLQGQVGTNDFQMLSSLVLLLLATIWGTDSIVGVLLAAMVASGLDILSTHVDTQANLQYLGTGLGGLILIRYPSGVVRLLMDRIDAFRGRSTTAAAPAKSDALALDGHGAPRRAPARPRQLDVPAGPPPALELRNIRAGYGKIEVVHGVDLVMPPGTVMALLGPNGAGKSTLLRVAAGLKQANSGCVHISGVHVNGFSPEALARVGVCTIPEGRGIFPNLTVTENLRMMSYRTGSDPDHIAEKAFGQFPRLAERRTQVAGTMSGGEQQMLAMARAVATNPKVLFLDEISMGLAPLIVKGLYDLVSSLAELGLAILVVEQFANTALAVADYAAVMQHGRITLLGEAADVAPELSSAYLGSSA